ncbi:SOS response-associated peptidase [Salibacterium aidingense]|uniref:SOS response-associated peptidase n=1 Tax=Salibacterium aidingense TaxID=384933 RepID=UPI000419C0B1|nr:SOS response-associated peptidase [Salibacterium aidingense]
MCGRFTLTVPLQKIEERFDIEDTTLEDYEPSFNIAPGQNVAAVINDGAKNRLGVLTWGLVPHWASDPNIGYKMINARAETAHTKNSFKRPLETQRCILPADSFYEWKTENGKKQPYRIRLAGESLFALAGLWEKWEKKEGDKRFTCTILTIEANAFMEGLHHRMPVILKEELESTWLDPGIQDHHALQNCLAPIDSSIMEAYPVSKAVNNVKNNAEDLLNPL